MLNDIGWSIINGENENVTDKRIESIIYLMRNNSNISSQELADILNVSKRTILQILIF